MLSKLIAEFLGTTFFLSAILATGGNPIAAAVGLGAAIFAFSNISGGHFNPAVSVMMFAQGKMNMMDMLIYICAQILGALLALGIFLKTKVK